ncbi:MAG: hypothetical protein J7L69_07135 [Desulfobulbaceae bacterium]|nr:hypothetical protein [Desulfobulbaceae bacterium]
MTKKTSKTKQIVSCFLILCKILIGLLVMKTGFDLATGTLPFYYNHDNNFLMGLFIMMIGAYIIFSSLFRQLFDAE